MEKEHANLEVCLVCLIYFHGTGSSLRSWWLLSWWRNSLLLLNPKVHHHVHRSLSLLSQPHFSPKDGDRMFLQNIGICLQVHMASQPRRTNCHLHCHEKVISVESSQNLHNLFYLRSTLMLSFWSFDDDWLQWSPLGHYSIWVRNYAVSNISETVNAPVIKNWYDEWHGCLLNLYLYM
jgi:hypothetical protein